MKKYFTTGDIILTFTLLLLSFVSMAWTGRFYEGGKHVVVEVDGKRILELPLDRNDVRDVQGPLGKTVINVQNGAVFINESACHNKICLNMGRIRYAGEVIVCIPNRVFVTIKGNGGGKSLDGVTR